MKKKKAFILIDALFGLLLAASVGLILFISIVSLEVKYKETLNNENYLISTWLDK